MSRVEKFNELMEKIKAITTITHGREYFEYEEPSYFSRMPFWKKAVVVLLHSNAFLFVTSIFYGIYRSREDIIFSLELLMYLVMFFMGLFNIYLMNVHRELFCGTAKVLRSNYRTTKILENVYCSRIFQEAATNSLLLVKILTGICIVGFFSTSILGTAASAFLHKSPYPLPVSVPLIGIGLSNYWSYAVSLLLVITALTTIVASYCGLVCIGLTVNVYLLAYVDSAMEILKNTDTILEDHSFTEYSKTILDYLVLSKSIMVKFSEATEMYFFAMQQAVYVMFLSCWIIVNTDVWGVFQVVPGLCIVTGVLFVVIFQEAVLQKYEDLRYAIYDVAWYNLSVTDQKAFILFLLVAQNPSILNAGGFNDLTLDWYSNLYKQAYNMALFVGDMVL